VAEAAHRSGVPVGLDHPDRIRISTAGNAVLAFPGVPTDAEPAADVQGLGAILYALITATWPLPEPGVDGMPAAERGGDGVVTPARALRPEVPYEISALIARALQPESGIRTAAAVQTVLDQASVLDQQTDLMPVINDSAAHDEGHGTAESPLDYDSPTVARERHARAGNARSRKMLLALTALAVAAIVIVAALTYAVVNTLGGGSTAQWPSLSVPGSSTPGSAGPGSGGASPTTAPAGRPIVPTKAAVYSPQGTMDDSRNAGKAIDGDPATSWATDAYSQQLPRLKNGLGLMLTLPDSVALSSVTVDSPSSGTVVEIRSSPSATPDLSDTTVLTTTTLQSGRTTLTLNNMEPTRYLLVWITKLGGYATPYSSKIAELTLQRAG